jgi:hypothetical protein
MRISNPALLRFVLFSLWLILIPIAAWTQTNSSPARIVERVDESAVVSLRGNTHPLAQLRFDRGAAPPDLPMGRMLLVLKRSDGQEAALEALLDAQQDPSSPNYHQWLTTTAFGQQFGPSDQDLQTVAMWLQSHGFQVTRISQGRTVIEFSGTAAQVQQAFHTEVHKYSVNGADHWANVSDPQIPQALAPVVAGVNSLHNFTKAPAHHVAGAFSKSRATGEVKAFQPGFTISDPSFCGGAGDCYFVGPYDFATIYNVLPLWNASSPIDGTGQSIAIIGRSDIVLQDVRDFRTLFGLPANDPKFIVDGPDPGVVPGDETEAVLDVEWSGAIAKGATINLVISASTEATDGIDLSAVYAVENNVAPVISESFQQCELFMGTAGNAFENGIREQAAAQGITFITGSGDEAASGCDFPSNNTPAPAAQGLMVNGLASSPFGVAVGGTDFLNFGPNYTKNSLNLPSPYWGATNSPQEASALGYVPESTWNSTCTNNIFVVFAYGATPEASCNNSQAINFVETDGGGGGKSSCITSSDGTASGCSAGYTKPIWQSAPGVPADGARDLPDVSLFASSGFMGSAYIVCEADQTQSHGTCGLTNIEYDFLGIGGTSVSAPSFAGVMAMVNQYTGSAGQGNANYVFYKLASSSAQKTASCNSSLIPAGGCIFNDLTSGTIATPCAAKTLDCTLSISSDAYGVLSGYSAGAGYDLATGLGSVNAYNLVHGWNSGVPTSTTLSLNSGNAVNITHGQAVSFNIAVSPGAATGDVSLTGSPTSGSPVTMGQFTLQSGASSGTTTSLAGGAAYQVKAHYAGDSTYAASDSSPVTVTVAPEPSTTLISIPVFNTTNGGETGDAPSPIVYGSPYIERVDVGNVKAAVTFPMKPVCAPLSCPTGSVTLTDSLNGGTATPLGSTGSFPLNAEGYTEFQAIQLSGGTHQLSASYPGDNSYGASSGSYSLAVTPAPTQASMPFVPSAPQVVGAPVVIYTNINATNSFPGAGPTGTISFYDGGTQISGSVTYSNGQPGTLSIPAGLTGYITATFATIGSHQITAKYSGDANYAASTSPATTATAVYGTTASGTANPTLVNLGQSVSVTVTITGSSKTPPMTGNLQFSVTSNPVTPTAGTDANGNQTLTATVTFTPQTTEAVYVTYPGDANYEANESAVTVSVNIPDFSVNLPSSPLLVPAGQPGSVTVTVVPASNLSSTVALSCGGNAGGELPAGYSCAFSPASVNLSNSASATSSLTLSPSAQPAAALANPAAMAERSGLLFNSAGVSNGFLLLFGLLAVTLLVSPVEWTNRRLRTAIFIFGVICLAAGCGGAPSGGGEVGGGGSTPAPQSTTTSVKASATKVAYPSALTFTATVSGSNNPTGPVYFYLNGNFSGSANLVGNTATYTGSTPWMGIYVLTAQYAGDLSNNTSTSTGVNLAVTGTSTIGIVGTTSTTNHFVQVTYTIQ